MEENQEQLSDVAVQIAEEKTLSVISLITEG